MDTMSTKEAFVSFDVARLLKEKGFDWGCCSYWCVFPNGDRVHTEYGHFANHNGNETDRFVSRPTQAMACRWLKETHGLWVVPMPCEDGGCYFEIYKRYGKIWKNNVYDHTEYEDYDDPEYAIEGGLHYCLTNIV